MPSWCRSATSPGRRRPAYGSRTTASSSASTASTTGGCGSTACGCRARRCSTGSLRWPRTAPTPARSRTRTAASSRCWARWSRDGSASAAPAINAAKVALAIAVRYGVRRRQFEAVEPDQEQLLLDYGMHQRRLFPLLARTYALHFAQEVVARSCTTSSPGWSTTRRPGASWSRGRPAPRHSAPGTPPGRSRSAARRAAGRDTSPSTGSPRSRPTPTCSRRSRATTTCCSSSWPRGC